MIRAPHLVGIVLGAWACVAAACSVTTTHTPADRAAIAPEYRPAVIAGPPVATVIRVHVDVSPAVAPDVVAGIRAWADATREWRAWELAGPASANLFITEVVDQEGHCADVGYPIAGCAGAIGGLDVDPPGAQIWLLRGSYENAAKWVTMHEIGHTLGLTHLDGTLMAQHPDQDMGLLSWDCPDPVTLLRVSWRVGVNLACR